jgi:hypothetical protein
MKGYTSKIINTAKKMYVQDGKSANDISEHFKNKPTAQTILNWVKKEEWDKLRAEHRNREYEKLSPKALAEKILEKINNILNIDSAQFSTKDADSLAKLQSALGKITARKYQLPMMFQLLTDLINFLNNNYPHLVTDDFIRAIRDFKEWLKNEVDE